MSSAIAIARERGAGPASDTRLRSAFNRFDESEASRILEESLAVRSLERTVEEVLLPAVETLAAGRRAAPSTASPGAGPRAGSPRRMRVSPAATRDEGVVIFDASTACDIESLYVQALELALRRRGMRTLTHLRRTGSRPHGPRAARGRAARRRPRRARRRPRRARAARLRRTPHRRRRRSTICDFRHALPDSGASTVTRLGDKPIAAVDHLIAAIDGRELWPAAPTGSSRRAARARSRQTPAARSPAEDRSDVRRAG